MLRLVLLGIFNSLVLAACSSTEPIVELSAEAPLAVTEETRPAPTPEVEEGPKTRDVSNQEIGFSCSELPECSADGAREPYSCVAYRYDNKLLWEDQRIFSWGSGLCEAKKSLMGTACSQGKDLSKLADVSCSPDPSFGKCPASRPKCSSEEKPSRCMVKKYQGVELSWEQRPTAWGRNECEARHLLQVGACEQGLEIQDLNLISCEADTAPGQCPAPPPNCDLDQKDPTECTLSALGDTVFKKPWRAIGTSACEAQYRLQAMVCRFADSKRPLAQEKLKEFECRSLLGSPALAH